MLKKVLCNYGGELKELQSGDNINGLENITNDAQLKRAAGDINTFSEKPAPEADDILLIEDCSDSYTKKKIKKSSLAGKEIKLIVKTTNETILSSAIYQNDDSINTEIAANGIYQYELLLMVNQQGGASAGFKARFSAPAGATAYSNVLKNLNSNNSFVSSNVINSLILNQESGAVTGSGDYNFLHASGLIFNGSSAGSLILQWTQNVSSSINTSVMAGSYLKLIKVN